MSFKIPQKILAEIVGLAAKVSKGKSTLPIAECIRLHFGGDGVSVQATNFDNWITISTPGFKNAKDSATAIVPCQQFFSIISGIAKDQDIEFIVTDKKLTVKTPTSKYNFGLLPDADWPSLQWSEKAEPVTIASSALHKALSFTAPFIGVTDSRQYLNGLNVRPVGKNGLRFMASNGHTFAQQVIPMENPFKLRPEGIMLPNALVGIYNELLGVVGDDIDIALEMTESKVRFTFKDKYTVSLIGRLLDMIFPDVDSHNLIQYERGNGVNTLPRKATLDALRRLMPMANTEKSQSVKIVFAGTHAVLSVRGQHGDAEETLELSHDGHKCEMHVGGQYLAMVLSAFDYDDLTVTVEPKRESEAPLVFTVKDEKISPDSPAFAIIMPMRG